MAKQTFTTGQVLSATQVNGLQTNDFNQTVSPKTASYVLVAADAGTRITMNSASATTVTVNTSLFAAGDTLQITNIGAGVSTITAGTATVSTAGVLTLAQNASGTLYFTSTGVSIWDGSAAAAASGGMTQLATGTLSGATTDVSGLSGSYKGLKAIVTGVTFAANGFNLELRFNNDSLALYRHANAFATQSDQNPTGTELSAVFLGGTSSNKNISVIDVWDYANTTTWKFCQTYGLSEGTTAGYVSTIAGQGIYKSTNAISSITFFADGGSFTGGTYTIYGVN